MKLPRELSGTELAHLLVKFDYQVTRQAGSHVRLTSNMRGREHHITIPAHKNLKVGTLAAILKDVCSYLEISRSELERELFDG